jgi:hypothetical protein
MTMTTKKEAVTKIPSRRKHPVLENLEKILNPQTQMAIKLNLRMIAKKKKKKTQRLQRKMIKVKRMINKKMRRRKRIRNLPKNQRKRTMKNQKRTMKSPKRARMKNNPARPGVIEDTIDHFIIIN